MIGYPNQQQFAQPFQQQPFIPQQQYQQYQPPPPQPMPFVEYPIDRFLGTTNPYAYTEQSMPRINATPILPELTRFISRLASTIAQEMANTSSMNAARVFTFNQLVNNNWQNQDFDQVVQLALDNIALIIKENIGTNKPGYSTSDIDTVVKTAIMTKCALNIAQSQLLKQVLPQNVIIEASNFLNGLVPLFTRINQLKQATAENNYRQPGRFNNQQFQQPQQQFQPYQPPNNGFQQPVQHNQNVGYVPQQFNNSRFNQPTEQFNNGFQRNGPLTSVSQNVSSRDFFVPEFRPIVFNNGVPEQSYPQQQFQQPQQYNQFPEPVNQTQPGILQEWSSSPTPQSEPDLAVQAPLFRMPEVQHGLPEDNTNSSQLMNPVLEYAQPGHDIHVINTDIGEKLIWKPSDLQPFPVAWDCLSEKIVLKKVSYKGKVFVVQQLTDLTEEEMDEMRHAIGPQSLRDKAMVRAHSEQFLRNESLEEGSVVRTGPKVEYLEDCVRVSETYYPNTQDEVEAVLGIGAGTQIDQQNVMKMFPSQLKRAGITKPVIENKDEEGNVKWSDVGFLSDAIFSTKISHLKNTNSATRIYRERFVVPKIFVSSKPLDDLFAEWTEKKTYTFLAEKLRTTLNGEKLATTEAIEFAAGLDLYLTSGINEFLSQNLHLTTKIESFCEDIDTITIDGYLKEKYGDFIHEGIMNFEKEFFEKYLSKIDDPTMIENIDERINEEDSSDQKVHYIALECAYTITSVRAHSTEFKLPKQFADDIGLQKMMISPKNTDLFEFCNNLFEDTDIKQYNWMKHLIVTSDSKVYVVDSSDHGTIMYAIQELAPIWLMP